MAVSKRVQVLLRDRIAELVEGLAECEGVSVSRFCGLLIEEALRANGELTIDHQLHARAGVQVRTVEVPTPTTSQPTEVEADDDDEMVELLAMAKKLKALQKAGLL